MGNYPHKGMIICPYQAETYMKNEEIEFAEQMFIKT